MAVVKCSKVETTSVSGVLPLADVYGFCISVHSETEEFNFLGNIDLDTALLSEANAAIVNDFINLVKEQLAAS